LGYGGAEQAAAVMVTNGSGGYVTRILSLPRASGRLVFLGDADADGDRDVYLVGQGVTVFRNDGGGTFLLTSDRIGTTALTAPHVAFGDLDGDGRADLVTEPINGDHPGIDLLFAGLDPDTLRTGIAQV